MNSSIENQSQAQQFPCPQKLMIKGPDGHIELITGCLQKQNPRAVVIISHPHPLHGGTMQNKVVHYVAKTVEDLGLISVRYNFRGVGKSTGRYAEGIGEQEDLLAVMAWVKAQTKAKIWLAGFSFGAYVAYRVAQNHSVDKLITIAPPVNHFDMPLAPRPDCEWMLIQGGADEVVPAEDVLAWREQHAQPPELTYFADAGHFFHGRLNQLREAMIEKLAISTS